jgi:arsenite-transporting ATPase
MEVEKTTATSSAFAPTLQNILDQKTLRWIFVGGKGGVGKTTSSCSLATLLSEVRSSVLIISTDPAHNLSDAFDQKFTKEPTLVNGHKNLFAMEVEVTLDQSSVLPSLEGDEASKAGAAAFMTEIISSVPGIDEAMSFAEIMKNVDEMKFETIIFDTAPTGHTLRLLNFPNLLNKGLEKLIGLKQKFTGVMGQFGAMFGSGVDMESGFEKIFGQMDKLQASVAKIRDQMKDPALTTFVAVCIPEFLSLFETERLVQELAKGEIDIRNIVVNQVLFPGTPSSFLF